jgi:hypothetical protein
MICGRKRTQPNLRKCSRSFLERLRRATKKPRSGHQIYGPRFEPWISRIWELSTEGNCSASAQWHAFPQSDAVAMNHGILRIRKGVTVRTKRCPEAGAQDEFHQNKSRHTMTGKQAAVCPGTRQHATKAYTATHLDHWNGKTEPPAPRNLEPVCVISEKETLPLGCLSSLHIQPLYRPSRRSYKTQKRIIDVLAAMTMKIAVSCDVTPCSLIHHHQRLGLRSFPSHSPALGSLFYPDDGHSRLLRKISNDLPDCMAPYVT